jgi:CubicO group peptidase (beta-lactamase class C family)
MQRFLSLVFAALLAWPQFGAAAPSSSDGAFEASLRRLGAELTIPGMAYAIVGDGEILHTGQLNPDTSTPPLTIDTPLRFASVTKALTAVTLMRAVDRGALSLDDSLFKWLPEFSGDVGVNVRHLAAHSSEGIPGNEYVYGTSRYATLGGILTRALRAASFEEVLRKEILTPARMTWRDSPHLGAHAGFVSTVSDMALFVQALQDNRLLSRKRFEEMTTPFVSTKGLPMPVGVGFFSQQLGNERVVWSFGQDDPDHSSALLLMLPKRNLALVLLANTDELSNPFRLLMGDLRYSPFATAFLDAFAPEVGQSIGERERLAQDTLVSLWNQDRAAARQRFHQFARLRPGGPHDFVAHFIATSLVDSETSVSAQVLDTGLYAAHPTNRWVLLMSGGLNSQLERYDVAARRYEAILALRNQEPDGLASLFRAWSYAGLARIYKPTDPRRALQYVEQGLATGVTGGTRNDLIGLQKELASP